MSAVASGDIEDGILYPASDGKPVGETPRHVLNLFYCLYPLSQCEAERENERLRQEIESLRQRLPKNGNAS